MPATMNEIATDVFNDRYAQNGETVEGMWNRVASAIGDSDPEKAEFYRILDNFKFVPGGRILAGAGKGTEQTFYNCNVIPVEPRASTLAATPNVGKDSREAIFDTIGTMVDIMSRGGGVGINWSTLRPSESALTRVSGTSSGPVGWMDVASSAVGEVIQGGSRRGAAMFMLNDWHPDILKFVEVKGDNKRITNANVSVAVSDSFMQAVKSNADWTLRFPDTTHAEYNSRWDGDLAEWEGAGLPTRVYAVVAARDIWDSIVKSAHNSGEPGLVFLDRYNAQSTGAHAEKIICVNPCGEQGLGAYSVCNLGSMNLGKYVKNVFNFKVDTGAKEFDWEDFKQDVRVAVRFMDNVIDKSFYWDDRSKKRQQDLRRIGLGVMGLADALILLGIRYGSKEAVKFTESVFETMKLQAIRESQVIAEAKGPSGAYTPEVWTRPYLEQSEIEPAPLRNLFFLTQAPTGTTSTLAGASSGIEPLFDVGYMRKDRTGEHWVEPPVLSSPGNEKFSADVVVTANDIPVEEHVAMQAAVQKYVDSSVSKTVNAPNDQKVEEVDKLYMLAYDSGLKGLAYYRDGSRDVQVLNREGKADTMEVDSLKARIAQLEEEAFVGPTASERYTRPKLIRGVTSRLNTSMGTMYLTLNTDDAGKPVEIFVNVGKAGSDVMSMGEAVGRLVSLALQNNVALSDIAGQLVGVGGTSSFNPGLVHAVGKALENASQDSYVADPLPVERPRLAAVTNKTSGMACPECKNFSVVRGEGCQKCQNCGWSAC